LRARATLQTELVVMNLNSPALALDRQAIIVLGMHRSGTSALAGALAMAGARLPARLMPAQIDNPSGFFEPEKIVALHDRLLSAAGISWQSLQPVADEWLSTAEARAYVDELVTAVRQDYDDATLFVIKDPRMCRLMPLWRTVLERLGTRASFVIPIRHPLEVARSLATRENKRFSLRYGCLLWLAHMLDAERESRSSPRVFVHYDRLLDDPVRVVEDIISKVTGRRPALAGAMATAVRSFVDPHLRHHYAQMEELRSHSALYRWLGSAYGALGALVHYPHDRAAQASLDAIGDSFASDAVGSNTAWRLAPLLGFGGGLRRSLTRVLGAKH
jgi:hypothetical protein